MKLRNLSAAHQNYELLKLKRIQNYGKSTIKLAFKGTFIALVIIALMIQIIVSYTLS